MYIETNLAEDMSTKSDSGIFPPIITDPASSDPLTN